MKRTSKLKQNAVSPYYSSLLKNAASASLFVIALIFASTIAGLVFYKQFGPHTPSFFITTLLFIIVNSLILVAGGYGIGLLVSRKWGLSKRERVVVCTTYALMASTMYFPLTGAIDSLIFKIAPFSSPLFSEIGLLYTLVVVAIVGAVARYSRLPWRRFTMAALVIIFWLSQVVDGVQDGLNAARNLPMNLSSLLLGAGALIPPLVLFAIFYAPLKRIGQLARIYYATFYLALVSIAAPALSYFGWSSNAKFVSGFNIFVTIATLLFIAAIVASLVRLRRKR